jgi:deazaflavin-dependent oxidoreductase (nitroreductase family)
MGGSIQLVPILSYGHFLERTATRMSNSVTTKPNAVTAWMYRVVPKLPKSMRPKSMIVLHHTGRRSGQHRTTGLQQIYHDSETARYFVAAAYGPTSDWWRNVVENPQVSIDVGGRVLDVVADPVDPIEAGRIMEAAIQQDLGLRKKVFKHAKVAPSDPDGLSKVVATNPLMSFQTSESVDR